jgi:hypothetical protein
MIKILNGFGKDARHLGVWEGRTTFTVPFHLIPKSPSFEADHFIKLGSKDQVRTVESLKIMSVSSVVK